MLLLNNYGAVKLAPRWGKLALDIEERYWQLENEEWAFSNFTHYLRVPAYPSTEATIHRADLAAAPASVTSPQNPWGDEPWEQYLERQREKGRSLQTTISALKSEIERNVAQIGETIAPISYHPNYYDTELDTLVQAVCHQLKQALAASVTSPQNEPAGDASMAQFGVLHSIVRELYLNSRCLAETSHMEDAAKEGRMFTINGDTNKLVLDIVRAAAGLTLGSPPPVLLAENARLRTALTSPAGGAAAQIATLQSALESATDTNRVLANRLKLAADRLPLLVEWLDLAEAEADKEEANDGYEALYNTAAKVSGGLRVLLRDLNGAAPTQPVKGGQQDA